MGTDCGINIMEIKKSFIRIIIEYILYIFSIGMYESKSLIQCGYRLERDDDFLRWQNFEKSGSHMYQDIVGNETDDRMLSPDEFLQLFDENFYEIIHNLSDEQINDLKNLYDFIDQNNEKIEYLFCKQIY